MLNSLTLSLYLQLLPLGEAGFFLTPQKVYYMKTLLLFISNEEGATAIEYGLIAALISVASIVAMKALGIQLSTLFTGVRTNLVTR